MTVGHLTAFEPELELGSLPKPRYGRLPVGCLVCPLSQRCTDLNRVERILTVDQALFASIHKAELGIWVDVGESSAFWRCEGVAIFV